MLCLNSTRLQSRQKMPRPRNPTSATTKRKILKPVTKKYFEETCVILDSDDDFVTPNPSIKTRFSEKSYNRFQSSLAVPSPYPVNISGCRVIDTSDSEIEPDINGDSATHATNADLDSEFGREFRTTLGTTPQSFTFKLKEKAKDVQCPSTPSELIENESNNISFQTTHEIIIPQPIYLNNCKVSTTSSISSSHSWSGLMQRMQSNQKTIHNKLTDAVSKKSFKSSKLTNKTSAQVAKRSVIRKPAVLNFLSYTAQEASPHKKPKLESFNNYTMDEADTLESEPVLSSLETKRDEEITSSDLTTVTSKETTSVSIQHSHAKIPDIFLKPSERAAIFKNRKQERLFVQQDLCDALKELSIEPDTYDSVVMDSDDFEGNIVKLNQVETENPFGNKIKACPFYKKLPGTRFSVDAFNYGLIPGVEVYFLSHFHSDHYIGLSKKFCKTLVCSPPTATLVRMKFNVDQHCIRRLQINRPYVIDSVEVTLIHANHCPGSVMFVFRLLNGTTYFHTGDFRFTERMLDNKIFRGLKIDCLYLDTTYCDPQYNFPTQTEAITELITVVKRKLQCRPNTLIVCGSYVIGKERVYFSLAEAIGEKVFMNADKRRIIHALENPKFISYLSDREESASIHVHQMFSINPKFLLDYLNSRNGKYTQIIGVKPTGWQFSSSGDQSTVRSFYNDTVTIIGVPYSEHSSYSELEHFVRATRPTKVQPTVNVGNAAKRESMMCHINKWSRNENIH